MPKEQISDSIAIEKVEGGIKAPCCPEFVEDKACDYIDFHYRFKHPKTVTIDKISREVTVEVLVSVRLERCQLGLALGDLIYSTTLLPGEKVRLFSMDRHTKFSYDSESRLSYRHQQISEQSYYMNSMSNFMSKITSSESASSSLMSGSSHSTDAGTSGFFETIFGGPSVEVSGSHSAFSMNSFFKEFNQYAESSHNRSVQATRAANSIQIGEVQSRTHAEGETEDHYESSSRVFQNQNQCHAVTYLFYQVNKKQHVHFEVKSIQRRVIDNYSDTKVTNIPYVPAGKLTVISDSILATNEKRLEVEERDRESMSANLKYTSSQFTTQSNFHRLPISTQQEGPIPEVFKQEAMRLVDNDLMEHKIINKDGSVSKEVDQVVTFDFTTSIPTTGIIVKGCLDHCNTCEPTLRRKIILELENKKLQNDLLKRQIELLDKSQEYRCCPVGWDEEEIEVPLEA